MAGTFNAVLFDPSPTTVFGRLGIMNLLKNQAILVKNRQNLIETLCFLQKFSVLVVISLKIATKH